MFVHQPSYTRQKLFSYKGIDNNTQKDNVGESDRYGLTTDIPGVYQLECFRPTAKGVVVH